jgi:nicotinic acid mononucleotide adenylyltransferase
MRRRQSRHLAKPRKLHPVSVALGVGGVAALGTVAYLAGRRLARAKFPRVEPPQQQVRAQIPRVEPQPLPQQDLKKLIGVTVVDATSKYAVLLTTGSMNPMHKGHAETLYEAARYLHHHNYIVTAGVISLSADFWFKGKEGHKFSDDQRVAIARTQVQELNTINAETHIPLIVSEAELQRGKNEDYPETYVHLKKELGNISERYELFYVCGVDHAEKMLLQTNLPVEFDLKHVIVIKRGTKELKGSDGDRFFALLDPPKNAAAADASSTEVRRLLQDIDGLRRWMTPNAAWLAYGYYDQSLFRRSLVQDQLQTAHTAASKNNIGDLLVIAPITKQPESIVVATIASLEAAARVPQPHSLEGATFTVVRRMNARLIGTHVANKPEFGGKDAVHVQQIASQFNFLESPGSHYTAIQRYKEDLTQGLLASIACPRALQERDAWIRGVFHSGQEHDVPCLQPVLRKFADSSDSSSYSGGYLQMWGAPPSDAIQRLEKDVGTLNIAFQYGKTKDESSDNTSLILQVFQAAPSFQGAIGPNEDDPRTYVCKVLVAREYAALGHIAIIEAARLRKRVSLHVTMVGQGVFANPKSVFADALQQLVEVVQAHPVDVFLHGWKDEEVTTLEALLKNNTLQQLNVKELINVNDPAEDRA